MRKEIFGDLEEFMLDLKHETIKFCLEFIDKEAFITSKDEKKEEANGQKAELASMIS